MSHILQHSPGQQATIVFEIFNLDGYRSDGYNSSIPEISRVILPTLTLSSGYPLSMTKIDTGLFIFQFIVPSGGEAVGTYIVDVSYFDPDTGFPKQTFFQVVVSAPFGNYSISSV